MASRQPPPARFSVSNATSTWASEDMQRQALNVFRMRLLGAQVCPRRRRQPDVEGCDQRSDARLGHQRRRHLLPAGIGARAASVSADGPRIPVGNRPRGPRSDPRAGRHAARRRSSPALAAAAMPWAFSTPSSTSRDVRLIGVEAGGEQIIRGRHAARFAGGSAGVLQGTRTFVLQDEDGNIELTHSISAGLGLRGRRPRARVASSDRPRRVRLRHRRRSARGVSDAGAARGHSAGARIGARRSLTRTSWQGARVVGRRFS